MLTGLIMFFLKQMVNLNGKCLGVCLLVFHWLTLNFVHCVIHKNRFK
jgi:hypothetical protein